MVVPPKQADLHVNPTYYKAISLVTGPPQKSTPDLGRPPYGRNVDRAQAP